MYSNVNLKTIFEELLIILITIWKLIVVFVGKFLQILRVMQEKEGKYIFGVFIGWFKAEFALSPLLYEILRRIPFIRWCVLGEKR